MTQSDDRQPQRAAMPCSTCCLMAGVCPDCAPPGQVRGVPGLTSVTGASGIEAAQRMVRLRKGEFLYLMGDPVTSVYAIRAGTIKTHVTTEDGRTQVVAFHFPGDMVGLDSLVRPHYASYATALEDTKLCLFAADALRVAAATLAPLGSQLLLALDGQLQRARAVQTMLALMTAEERLVTFLLWLADGFALRGFSSSAFVLRMSREEIGSYIGLTLETVSRQFSRLAEGGLITVRHRTITLLDKPALRAIAARPMILAHAPAPRLRMAGGASAPVHG
ncbi:Crp/Fnr family transcriptional regulator [Cupriavidus nantongensis]|uniref:Cyclic nucleotide-binding protein n=1 Tax=Cupriavidus nantongensis TaxID=1796606 RepID=A0A142JSY6_9BURK|nr:helix-turn-helix domain-containing protein [Cupriavidus nantongensis]AMR81198.1 cyclic nucleotide-binding protein [Cupriavidus nantongensis]